MPGYDLQRPRASFVLPPELREISALTDIDDRTVAAVQDEAGEVFFIDLATERVTSRLAFGEVGDFEGLTRVGAELWVLRSDGVLFQLIRRETALEIGRRLTLRTDHRDLEGLGYDPIGKLILISPKDAPAGEKRDRAVRRVLAFDPTTGAQRPDAILTTSVDRIVEDAKRRGIELPRKAKGSKKKQKTGKERGDPDRVDMKLRFSSIAVHPVTGRLHLLSAVDGAVLEVDRDGNLCAAAFIDRGTMPKVEGITFLVDGDMVIASEGTTSPARIQVFDFDAGSASGSASSCLEH